MMKVVAPYDPIWMIISHPNGLNWLLY